MKAALDYILRVRLATIRRCLAERRFESAALFARLQWRDAVEAEESR